MARLAVSLQAGCLLALLACAVCVAAAAEGDAGKKQQQTATAGAQQYGGEDDHHPDHHHGREYDEYAGHDEGYDSYHHSDEHYFQKTTAKSVYLQETSRRDNFNDMTTTFTFRCAKESDAADSCLHPPHYGYDEHRDYDSDNFLTDLTTANNVAECIVGALEGDCPDIVPEAAGCYRVQANCTVTKQAEECGCPFADGFKFSSTGYYFEVNGTTSCTYAYEPNYLPPIGVSPGRRLQAATHGYHEHHNVTIYNGTASIITAAIDFVQTNYGYKEVKGKLDFLVDFGPTPAERRSTFGVKKAAKKTAKTANSHYDEDSDDEGHYHEHDTPYYGHEDRYYEGAHRSYGGYDGGDYSSSRHPKNLVKGGNLKITILEKQYY